MLKSSQYYVIHNKYTDAKYKAHVIYMHLHEEANELVH